MKQTSEYIVRPDGKVMKRSNYEKGMPLEELCEAVAIAYFAELGFVQTTLKRLCTELIDKDTTYYVLNFGNRRGADIYLFHGKHFLETGRASAVFDTKNWWVNFTTSHMRLNINKKGEFFPVDYIFALMAASTSYRSAKRKMKSDPHIRYLKVRDTPITPEDSECPELYSAIKGLLSTALRIVGLLPKTAYSLHMSNINAISNNHTKIECYDDGYGLFGVDDGPPMSQDSRFSDSQDGYVSDEDIDDNTTEDFVADLHIDCMREEELS